MSPRVVLPREAASAVASILVTRRFDAVCAELVQGEPLTGAVRLHPGVNRAKDIKAVGYDAWQEWADAWRDVESRLGPGVVLERRALEGDVVPARLHVTGLDAALRTSALLGAGCAADVERPRRVGRMLLDAGGVLTPATLRDTCALDDGDVEVAMSAVRWLGEQSDLTGWTLRQLAVPGMHSKWISTHRALLRALVGHDVYDEVRPRPAVAHVTYVDPDYLATGRRRHDAWTAGDVHDLPYRPRTVLVVENRDCRLWFPDAPGTVVVEGGGKAAAFLLSGVDWVRGADAVVYWGDMDADGFAILDHFRGSLAGPGDAAGGRPVASILMDGSALRRFAHLGVDRDPQGRSIGPSSAQLRRLTDDEAAAYHAIATAGPAAVRRIEQERIPLDAAATALAAVTGC